MSDIVIVTRKELPVNIKTFIKTEEPISQPPSLEEKAQQLISEIDIKPFRITEEGIEYKLRKKYAPTYPQILDALGVPHSMRGKQLPPALKAKVKEMQKAIGAGRNGAMQDSEVDSLTDTINTYTSGVRAESASSANTFYARLQLN